MERKPKVNPMPQLVTEHLRKPVMRNVATVGGTNPQRMHAAAIMIRERLPPSWRYGFKWDVLRYSWRALSVCSVFVIGKWMVYDPRTEDFQTTMPKYVFVRDNEGRAVSMAPARVAQQISRVSERSRRLREESDRSTGW
jgi:hypothetical protein